MQELQGCSQPTRSSKYQAALLYTSEKDRRIRDDYLNFHDCVGLYLTDVHLTRLREYYAFHAPVLILPMKQLAC